VSATDVLAAVTDVVAADVGLDESFGSLTIDVPADQWIAAATAIRDDPRSACGFFDWLSAYDDLDAGVAVVTRLWSMTHRHAVMLRAHVGPTAGALASLTGLWAGADWHERETFEMFGVEFAGHPHLVPLLLPDGFEGHPLRKDFVLASRVAKVWPGAKEPGESDQDRPAASDTTVTRRRPIQPPGVPEPGTWGPQR
jgi:NADH-quinone oxidoreductase subunit C